jgi:hypothetical protein
MAHLRATAGLADAKYAIESYILHIGIEVITLAGEPVTSPS